MPRNGFGFPRHPALELSRGRRGQGAPVLDNRFWMTFAQYLLGMAVNVFAVIPGAHPGGNASDYFGGAAAGRMRKTG